jgi:hypothetical protein
MSKGGKGRGDEEDRGGKGQSEDGVLKTRDGREMESGQSTFSFWSPLAAHTLNPLCSLCFPWVCLKAALNPTSS